MKNKNKIYQTFIKRKKKRQQYKYLTNNTRTTKGKIKLPKTMSNILTRPIVIVSFIILIVILFIPSMIVSMTGKKDKETQQINEQETNPATKTESIITEASAFEVAVMRSTTDTIENIPLETYVTRVVASEMPAEFEPEALKAQSLAARTYVVHYFSYYDTDESDDTLSISDDVEHQVYKNDEELRAQWGTDYQWKMNKIEQAVAATAGEILTYDEQPITPAYFSTSNGYTENSEEYWQSEIPYLRSVQSTWDEASPKFKNQLTFTTAEISTALNIDLINGLTEQPTIERTTGQRVKEITIGSKTFTGREVREKLNLPSSDFTIEQKDNHFVFTTKGYGHGVGMSQYGANGMAKEGKTYEDIIHYYYQDVDIQPVNDYTPAFVSK